MCEWQTCPTPMEVYAAANGAMTGIHVFFFYFVVTFVLWMMNKKLNKPSSLAAAPGKASSVHPSTPAVSPMVNDEVAPIEAK